ncbi:helix-turn-helix transcriptional regulator [Paraburkholderia diazotrophica]|uniref:helix-turn-helix transcriptional regulator n=1 Tax=Paraburkholderia diazotrophica TaxID=667676 RepID=UPI00317AB894
MEERLLSMVEVRVDALGQSTIYRLIGMGRFPTPVSLGVGARVAWKQSDIECWIAERIAAAQATDQRSAHGHPKARPAVKQDADPV